MGEHTVKLLTEFEQQLAALRGRAPLVRVWMTSFNLNIPFIEKYLLPRVLDGEVEPVTRMDYELLQSRLNESGLDLRIFCDHRLAGSDQVKRTALKIHPVAPRLLQWPDAEITPDRHTLFHPKVILLQNSLGETILGTGSANLTLGGWGRNQEVFRFYPVSARVQYQAILDFFAPLRPFQEQESQHEGGLPPRCRYLPGETGWRFVHSFQPGSFLSTLFRGMRRGRLTVWSPYLAADLAGFWQQLAEESHNASLSVSLVSDRVDGRVYRTRRSEALLELMAEEKLHFCHNPLQQPHSELMHAKIWHLHDGERARMATGSWNFTPSGVGHNIEAGVVQTVPVGLAIAGAALPPEEVHFASPEQLDALGPDWPLPPPFDLQVHWDWQRGEYTISGSWAEGKPQSGYRLHLPGVKGNLTLEWAQRRSKGKNSFRLISPTTLHVADNTALLHDRAWQTWRRREVPFSGPIVESHPHCRPAQGYASLNDLLQDLILQRDPQQSDSLLLRGLAENLETDGSPVEHATDTAQDTVSWHGLFLACSQLRTRLDAAATGQAFYQQTFGFPGGLAELVAFARQPQAHPSPLFRWFLIQELSSLVNHAGKLAEAWPELSGLPWSRLALPSVKLPVTVSPQYQRWIKKNCGYEKQ